MRRALFTGCAARVAFAPAAFAQTPVLTRAHAHNAPASVFMPLVSESWLKVARWNDVAQPPAGLPSELSRVDIR
jgi:hypothetical protein